MANLLGFATEERICLWEKGGNLPNVLNAVKLSEIYNVDIGNNVSKDRKFERETNNLRGRQNSIGTDHEPKDK